MPIPLDASEAIIDVMQLTLPSPPDTAGRLLLERGDLAGRHYRFESTICSNPVCGCQVITLQCSHEEAEPPTQTSSPVCLEMDLDLAQKNIANLQTLKADPAAITVAKAIGEEISEADWTSLSYFFFQTKQYWTEHTDLNQLDAYFPPEVLVEEGGMVGYHEIFPYAKPIEYTRGTQPWLVDDQYCFNPNCSCREAILSFIQLAEPGHGPAEASLVVRYAYRTGRSAPLPGQEGGQWRSSAPQFVKELREARPDLNSVLAERQARLRHLYRRASRGKTITTVKLPAPKPGRNDPCPCGSGKKYKKCCAA